MGNWQEKMREIEEAERQRLEAQEKSRIIKQEEDQLGLRREEELRNRTEIERNEQKANFFGIFERLGVRQNLEDIRRQVWQNQGAVVEGKTDSTRTMRLYSEYKTKIPENVRLGWTEKESRVHNSQDGTYRSSIEDVWKHKTEIAAWHDVIKPSYLEVEIDVAGLGSKWSSPAILYVLDTDVHVTVPWSLAEEIRIGRVGHIKDTFSRDVYFKDKSGGIFHKEPHNDKEGSNSSKKYSIEHKVMAFGAAFELTPSTSDELISEFLNISLASSCVGRQSKGKLPSQLK